MSTSAVPIIRLSTKDEFLGQVYPTRKPAILRGVDLGPATQLWTPEYLCQCWKGTVKAHVCPVPQMDFIKKNFAYKYVYSKLHKL